MILRILSIFLVLIVTACASSPLEPQTPEVPDEALKEEVKPELGLTQSSFDTLLGWNQDNLKTAAFAFEKSCMRILKGNPDKKMGALEQAGTYADWRGVCAKFVNAKTWSSDTFRAFIEENFTPYLASANTSGTSEAQGLFTGYYEASLRGSKTRSEQYNIPLYARPDDLVMVQLGEFRDELKGQRIAGRLTDGNLKPYESREEIVDGNWPHNDKVLVWVDDAVDAFFVQIQGSGVVQLEEGGVMRIGYAGQNGHPYYAIGRELIAREHLTKENVSMQSIRAWLAANPDQADEVMNTNKSYVFFRSLDEGPIGGEGVVLTAGRSLAVDRSLWAYGMPFWVELQNPAAGVTVERRLMIAQDTGGAIRGPVRGDVFWGYGEKAEAIAGQMKAKGRYWVLLPKGLFKDAQ